MLEIVSMLIMKWTFVSLVAGSFKIQFHIFEVINTDLYFYFFSVDFFSILPRIILNIYGVLNFVQLTFSSHLRHLASVDVFSLDLRYV